MKGRDPATQPEKNLPFCVRPAPYFGASHLVYGTEGREGQSRRQTATATTTGRKAIHPSVCGVQLGQMLSLSPSLGLEKTKTFFVEQQNWLWQQQQQHAQHTQHHQQLLRQRSCKEIPEATRSAKGGQQRCCRLQPLGVVNVEVVKPEHLLGVIPMTFAKTDKDCRPKSSSAPIVIHCHEHTTNTKNKHRKQSYSAILNREFSGVELGQMLCLSRHVALVPQDEGTTEFSRTHSDHFCGSSIGTLSRSKARGLHSPRNKSVQQMTMGANGTPQVEKLPPIPRDLKTATSYTPAIAISQNIVDELSEKLTQTADSDSSTSTIADGTALPLRIPRIVSIGEVIGLERPMAGVRIKRPSSSCKGHLSYGWSSPQSMGELKGSLIYIPTATSVHKQVKMTKVRSGKEESIGGHKI